VRWRGFGGGGFEREKVRWPPTTRLNSIGINLTTSPDLRRWMGDGGGERRRGGKSISHHVDSE